MTFAERPCCILVQRLLSLGVCCRSLIETFKGDSRIPLRDDDPLVVALLLSLIYEPWAHPTGLPPIGAPPPLSLPPLGTPLPHGAGASPSAPPTGAIAPTGERSAPTPTAAP